MTVHRLGPLASYLTELGLTSYPLLAHLPSDLAAAAVLVAQWALGSAAWTPTLGFYTRKAPADIELAAHHGAHPASTARWRAHGRSSLAGAVEPENKLMDGGIQSGPLHVVLLSQCCPSTFVHQLHHLAALAA